MKDQHEKAYIVAVDMGYGHQRAAYPLLGMAAVPASWNLSDPIIISANEYPSIPRTDKIKWYFTRKTYESISRFQGFPIFGKRIFHLMSYLQRIEPFYPRRDLSAATFPVKLTYALIKNGLGRHLIDVLNEKPLPFVSSFPIPAFCAEEHGYKGDIYCLCTDTDISRAWAPRHPDKSRIKYLAPTARVRERLKLYGVPADSIILTGFPLPKEAIGDKSTYGTAIVSLLRRMTKLDPQNIYHKKFKSLLSLYMLLETAAPRSDKPVTVTFAIGGAGAQADIAVKILASFDDAVRKGRIRLNLVAGTSSAILKRFEGAIRKASLEAYRDKGVNIIYRPDKYEYFKEFDALLSETDILWTKPSELSFYAGLGIPIIMSPALGSQEEFNQAWLHMMGAGFEQYDPRYASEWLFEWIESGWLAEAAMNGFLNASKDGTSNIEASVLKGKRAEIEDVHFV